MLSTCGTACLLTGTQGPPNSLPLKDGGSSKAQGVQKEQLGKGIGAPLEKTLPKLLTLFG